MFLRFEMIVQILLTDESPRADIARVLHVVLQLATQAVMLLSHMSSESAGRAVLTVAVRAHESVQNNVVSLEMLF